QAVDKAVRQIAFDKKLQETDFHELRRRLLEAMVPFYEQIIAQRQDDPKLAAERGRALGRMAYLYGEMGAKEQALMVNEQMRALFAQQVDHFPTEPNYRQNLAVSLNNRGYLLRALGKRDEADAAYRHAVRLFQQLADDFPEMLENRQELAKLQ